MVPITINLFAININFHIALSRVLALHSFWKTLTFKIFLFKYFSGYVFDHYGNYSISFYIAGCDLLLIIFVVFLGKALTKKLPSSRRASRNSSIIKDDSLDTPKKSPQRHSIKEEDTKAAQSVRPISCMESSV